MNDTKMKQGEKEERETYVNDKRGKWGGGGGGSNKTV